MGTGAGERLNFGKTAGSKETSAPITSLHEVRYSRQKTDGYLLNPYHPLGAAKAKFMKDVLGYSQSDSKLFHKNVTLSILGKMPTKTETSKYGVKHTYKTNLISKNGNSVTATVIVVVQKDNDRTTYKIVTVYPY